MKIRLGELRQVIREELAVIEEAATEEIHWLASELKTTEALKLLGSKTLLAIINRSEEKVEGKRKRKTKVDLGPALDGTQEWPTEVSYPGATSSQRVVVTWESADQYREVKDHAISALDALAPKREKKLGTPYSRQVAWEYATGKRF